MALFRRFVVAVTQNSLVVSGIRGKIRRRRLFTVAHAESKRETPEDQYPFIEVCSSIRPDPEDYVIAELPAEEVVFRRITMPRLVFESAMGKEKGALKLHIATEIGIDPSSFTAQVLSVIPSGDVNAIVVVIAKVTTIANHVSFLTSAGFPEPDVLEVAPIKWLHTVDWASASPSCFVVVLDIDYAALFLFHDTKLLNVYVSLEDNLANALGALADVLGTEEWTAFEEIRSGKLDPSVIRDVFLDMFPYNLARHVSYLVGSTPELPSGRVSELIPVTYVVSPFPNYSNVLVEAFKVAESLPFPDVSIEVAPSVLQRTELDMGALPLVLRGGEDLVKGQLVPAQG